MKADIPFEIWHPIIRDVYTYTDPYALIPDTPYVLSPLHQRLLIHRFLSLVSRQFHALSQAVFMEDLDLRTPESLLAVSRVVKANKNIARTVRSLSFNFFEYRCGASAPRRGRKLKDREGLNEPPPDLDPIARAEALRILSIENKARITYTTYRPSVTRQPQHWTSWCSFLRTILVSCKGASYIRINALADYSQYGKRPSGHDYRSLFGAPKLDNDGIIAGLLECSNLQVLHLVDPSPLSMFGPSLKQWHMLRELDITLSSGFPQVINLPETYFCPPRHLERFALHDLSPRRPAWPQSSDLGGCKDLQSLDIGVLDISNESTFGATKFLVTTYQETLIELKLQLNRHYSDITGIFNGGNVYFPKLRILHVRGGRGHVSLFAQMRLDVLESIELGWLNIDDDARARENEYWNAFFTQSSLKRVKRFHVRRMQPVVHRAFKAAALALGISTGLEKAIENGADAEAGDEDEAEDDEAGEGGAEGEVVINLNQPQEEGA